MIKNYILHKHLNNVFDLLEEIDKRALIEKGTDATINAIESVNITKGIVKTVDG